ncbi:MAG TPA: sigma factor-like helix-turn-helix DNA-binding protein [Candidatus Nanoarchaeia archaeon]|nr:sigma factor-like helix-turn-helix DNA-binding protein [Candidatus Nanoarchaeia archaeon]
MADEYHSPGKLPREAPDRLTYIAPVRRDKPVGSGLRNALLYDARKQAGLTIAEASKGIGISTASLDSYELVHRCPSPPLQQKICAFYRSLGISLEESAVFPLEFRDYCAIRKDGVSEDDILSQAVPLYRCPERMLPRVYNHAEALLYRQDLETDIKEALSLLTQQQRMVLGLYFGIGDQAHSLDEISSIFSLTRERIRQIKEVAIKTLRRKSKSRELLRSYLAGEDSIG